MVNFYYVEVVVVLALLQADWVLWAVEVDVWGTLKFCLIGWVLQELTALLSLMG